MFKKIQSYLVILLLPFAMAVPVVATTVPAYACDQIAQDVASGANSASTGTVGGGCGTNNTLHDTSIGRIGREIVTIFSYIVGVVSIIMIIYGGFRYITSGGESSNVSSAKNTIIYALIGLIIVALAQALVHWVLNTTNTVVTP